MKSRVLIHIATYNERESLPKLILAIQEQAPSTDILVIDDDSPDGTGQWADETAARDGRIRVIHRPRKSGLGSAILRAMRYAIEHNYDFLINMDADFSHHPRYLPAMIDGMNGSDRRRPCDVLIGSRYVPGGGVLHWPFSRLFISLGVNYLCRLLLRVPARDASGGYRCYRVSKLKELDLNGLRSQGYSFQEEMLFRLAQVGCRVAETPIVFEDRRAGESKADFHESVRSLGVLLDLGIANIFGRNLIPRSRFPLQDSQL